MGRQHADRKEIEVLGRAEPPGAALQPPGHRPSEPSFLAKLYGRPGPFDETFEEETLPAVLDPARCRPRAERLQVAQHRDRLEQARLARTVRPDHDHGAYGHVQALGAKVAKAVDGEVEERHADDAATAGSA